MVSKIYIPSGPPGSLKVEPLLGYEWHNLMYVDRVLPMGLHSAALICQRVKNAVPFIYNKWGWFVVNLPR